MQPIHQKPLKKMTLWPAVALLAALLAVLCIFFFQKKEQPAPPKKDESITLATYPSAGITALTINPTASPSFTILCENGSSFQVLGNESYPLDTARLVDMLDALSPMVAAQKIHTIQSEKELTDFGITDTSFSFCVRTKSGQEDTWQFGHEIPGEQPGYFMRKQGDRDIYLTPILYPNDLNASLKELHTVPPINFTKNIIQGIHIATPQNTQSLELSNGLWYATAPFRYPLQPGKVEKLLDKVSSMRLAVFEADETPESLKNYGLDTPAVTLRLDIAPSTIISTDADTMAQQQVDVPAHQITIKGGNTIEGIGFYCLYKGAVYKVSNLSMGFLKTLSLHDMTLRTPINISLNALEKLTIQNGVSQNTYQFIYTEQIDPNNHLRKDSLGNPLFDQSIQKNGIPIDEKSFYPFYQKLNALYTESRLPEGFTPAESPLYTIEIQYDTGHKSSGMRCIAFFPYDALHAAVAVDGVCLYAVPLEQITALLGDLP